MCICLPNGKFSLKFSRSPLCLGKKVSKNKANLINDTSDEEDINHNVGYNKSNGCNIRVENAQYDQINHHGHLLVGRQLPPVPNGTDGGYNASTPTTMSCSSITTVVAPSSPPLPLSSSVLAQGWNAHHLMYHSDADLCIKQGCTNNNCFFHNNMDEAMQISAELRNRNSDFMPYNNRKCLNSLEYKLQLNNSGATNNNESNDYSSVQILGKRRNLNNNQPNSDRSGQDDSNIENCYTQIQKNNFNSLRKPPKVRSIKDQCYQSLQTLVQSQSGKCGDYELEAAPVIPTRHYSPHELPLVIKHNSISQLSNEISVDNNNNSSKSQSRLRQPSASSNTNSIRRFSQPYTVNQNNMDGNSICSTNQTDNQLLKNLQSQFNTPPIVRASIGDVRDATSSLTIDGVIDEDDNNDNGDNVDCMRPIMRDGENVTNFDCLSNEQTNEDDVYSIPHKQQNSLHQHHNPMNHAYLHHQLTSSPSSHLQGHTNVYEMVDEPPPLPALPSANNTNNNHNVYFHPPIPNTIVLSNSTQNPPINIHNRYPQIEPSQLPPPPPPPPQSSTITLSHAAAPITNNNNNDTNYCHRQTSVIPEPPPAVVPYLGHDNYISITNTARNAFNNQFTMGYQYLSTSSNSSLQHQPLSSAPPCVPATTTMAPTMTSILPTTIANSNDINNEKPYSLYTCGSDLYAEISDVYLSRQYEELNDVKPFSSSLSCDTKDSINYSNNKTNNNDVIIKSNEEPLNSATASPGTMRVLLEIQSFRHMDSDVDVSSSRCTTPLHPSSSAVGNSKNYVGIPPRAGVERLSISPINKYNNNNITSDDSHISQHPWFLPHRTTSIMGSPLLSTSSSSMVPIDASNKSGLQKLPKLPIMTPVMERSMEGSSHNLHDNCISSTLKSPPEQLQESDEISNLYELLKHTNNNNSSNNNNNNSTFTNEIQPKMNERYNFIVNPHLNKNNNYTNKKDEFI